MFKIYYKLIVRQEFESHEPLQGKEKCDEKVSFRNTSSDTWLKHTNVNVQETFRRNMTKLEQNI